MPLRTSLLVPGLITVSWMMGCGGGAPAEKLVPVGGTLLIDGEPLDGVVVTFTPTMARNSRGGSGMTDDSGAFTVMHLGLNQPGLSAGTYTISYSRMRLPDGSAAPELEPGQPPDPENIQVEKLPAHLTMPNPKLPGSQVEIPEDGNTDLELKASIKPPN